MPRFAPLCAVLASLPMLAGAGETAYLVPRAADVAFTPIMTVGEGVGAQRMAGVPDGLGAYDNGDGTFSLLMNHELRRDAGRVRGHGQRGAFVSRWTIRKADLAVLDLGDLVSRPEDVFTWNPGAAAWVPGSTAFARLCSANLAAAGSLSFAGEGYAGHIFMNGEEDGDEGRAFAWIASGDEAGRVYELPALGKLSWENAVANPLSQARTIVIGLDDDGLADSALFAYVGVKQAAGNAVERAGLHNGRLYGLRVAAANQVEDAVTAFGPARAGFTLIDMGVVTNASGKAIEAAALAAGVSQFRRAEDGAWDPTDPRRFYFTTTADARSRSRLWRLTLRDIAAPEKGGEIELLLDGGDGENSVMMLDNLTVDEAGGIILQEDPGKHPRLARVWAYAPATRRLRLLAEHDPARFGDVSEGTAADYHDRDEESSGVIEVTQMFRDVPGYDTDAHRYFLLVSQAHKAAHPAWSSAEVTELGEGGQLLLMRVGR